MKIEGVPEGWEIRTVYDAQSLADAIVQGDQRLHPGERVVCAIIRRIEPVCTWQHGVFPDGWITEDLEGVVAWISEKPRAGEDAWLRPLHGKTDWFVVSLGKKGGLLLNPPKFRDDLPWTERIQQVGPTIEATLRGEG